VALAVRACVAQLSPTPPLLRREGGGSWPWRRLCEDASLSSAPPCRCSAARPAGGEGVSAGPGSARPRPRVARGESIDVRRRSTEPRAVPAGQW
jgi:hypothetical protein